MADPAVADPTPTDELEWVRTTVGGRPASYGVAGTGPVVVFLHGWGLSHRAYRKAPEAPDRREHVRVRPALPAFGSADLPGDDRDLPGYARWVHQFLDAVGLDEPVTWSATPSAAGWPSRPRTTGRPGWPAWSSSTRSVARRGRTAAWFAPSGTAAVGLGPAHAGRRAAATSDRPRAAGDRGRRRAEHAAPSARDRACCRAGAIRRPDR